MGWFPSMRCASGLGLVATARALLLAHQLLYRVRGLPESLLGLAFSEDDRLGVGVAEVLPHLDRVRHVGYLCDAFGLVGESFGLGVGLEEVGVDRGDVGSHRHLAGRLEELAVVGLAGGEPTSPLSTPISSLRPAPS